ncbi:recombinase RecA [Thermoanaerobacter mathranii]|uniref:recombinase RecA n=1 Tax=Thermoanaerobacter mathranii TaxID=583357 RepID=UPI003D6B4F4E
MDDKEKALSSAIMEIERKFGKGAIMRLGDRPNLDIEVIPTGCLELDIALGIGGVPRGRIIEIFGPESSGKTTLALHIIAEAQKAGGTAVFVDAEHALDPMYARKLGVDLDQLLVAQPDTGEQALEIVDALIRSSAVDIVVIDSVAALVPKAEIDGEIGEGQIGLQARLMSQALRKLAGSAGKSKTAVVFINQLREKIGVTFGNPEITPGGRALKFYATVRIEVRKGENIKQGDKVIGSRVKIKVVKNKLAPPFKQAEVDMTFGEGISKEGSLLDLGTKIGLVEKSGSWYSYGTIKLGQGRENAKQFLKENPDIAYELEKKIKENFASVYENLNYTSDISLE